MGSFAPVQPLSQSTPLFPHPQSTFYPGQHATTSSPGHSWQVSYSQPALPPQPACNWSQPSAPDSYCLGLCAKFQTQVESLLRKSFPKWQPVLMKTQHDGTANLVVKIDAGSEFIHLSLVSQPHDSHQDRITIIAGGQTSESPL